MYSVIQSFFSKIPLFFGAPPPNPCDADRMGRFFGLPKWYRFLSYSPGPTGRCEINISGGGISSDYWLIGIAVLQIVIQVAGMVALAFVIWGGFTYITSTGEPEKLAEARKTIINALIGIVIAVLAVSIVGYVGNKLGGV